ncbi:MAG: hypothetical protein QGG99_03550, partial [Candidatus Poseidoniia archaeon]|nr:hypothetical protein [Candidatus Poseidoniia archaeon]
TAINDFVVGRPNEGDIDVVLCVKLTKGTDFDGLACGVKSSLAGLLRTASRPSKTCIWSAL